MRKFKKLSFEIGEISVKELSVRQVLNMGEGLRDVMDDGSSSSDFAPILGRIRELFDLTVEGMTWDQAQDLAPSEIKEVYEAFREVNEVFFDLARTLGLAEMMEGFLASIKSDLSSLFASSSLGDTTEPES